MLFRSVVWQSNTGDGGTIEIYLYDGTSTTRLTTNSYTDERPAISGSNVAWNGAGGGPGAYNQIYYYNGSSVSQLTSNSFDSVAASVSGTHVVWEGRGGTGSTLEIYHNGSPTQLTSNAVDDFIPKVDGSKVVWFSGPNNSPTGEIFLYNGSSVSQITTNGYFDQFPVISGNNIAWIGRSGGISSVDDHAFFYDGTGAKQVSISDYDSSVAIDGAKAVWMGWNGTRNQIYLYDNATGVTSRLTHNNYVASAPQISGTSVVWVGTVNGVYEIFLSRDLPLLPGDANADFKVDGADLALWQQNYDPLGLNPDNNYWEHGDWNDDGKIDGGDLGLWQQNYSPLGYATLPLTLSDSLELSTVPEPGTIYLALAGTLGIGGFVRRAVSISRSGARRR